MKVFAGTDIGKVRQMNQDTYFISEEAEEPKIYLLADGMGGYAGGEIASNLAIHSVKQHIQSNWEKISKTEKEILNLIKEATQYANSSIYEKANQVKAEAVESKSDYIKKAKESAMHELNEKKALKD